MKDKQDIKQALYRACQQHIAQRIEAIEQKLQLIDESRNSETKNSVGDKYETGRAMLELEEEKGRAQLLEAHKVQQELLKIDPDRQFARAVLGSLVSTTNGEYYLAVGIGRIRLDNKVYYCISMDSPIGQRLRDMGAGAEVEFNGVRMRIEVVS